MKMLRHIALLGLIGLITTLTACAGGAEGEARDYEVTPRGFDIQSLAFLKCPLTEQKLRLAKKSELDNLNAAVEDLSLGYLNGQPVRGYLRGLLIREDGKVAYPVINGEAKLYESEAIDLVKRAKSDPNKFNNMGRRE